MAAPEVFLTTEQVMDYLHVSLRTVYRLTKTQQLPAVRVGRQWRFRKGDVDAWLSKRVGEHAHSVHASRRKRVLVVDDEASIREWVTRTLSAYDVDSAADGLTALDRMKERPYDLLLADLRLPGMTGMGLLREVRHVWKTLPVIIITGFSSEESKAEAVDLGITGYLVKPVAVQEIQSLAATVLAGIV